MAGLNVKRRKEMAKQKNHESLEALISEISFNIVKEGILNENEINKLLGVLSNDGVYAMWVYAKSKKEIKEEKLMDNLKELLEKVENVNNSYETYFISVANDISKLLFLKQLLEKTLIYARYHAKALEDSNE
jgi:hydroxymethylpyrimidine/phosphomethylpyrimidine kinase